MPRLKPLNVSTFVCVLMFACLFVLADMHTSKCQVIKRIDSPDLIHDASILNQVFYFHKQNDSTALSNTLQNNLI